MSIRGSGGNRGTTQAVLTAIVIAAFLLVPAAASAWTVTVHVHGTGTVSEVTNRLGGNRGQMDCTVAGSTANVTTNCVGGTANGFWSSGDVVRLQPSVSATAAGRGWVFDHWTDSTASGQINCDPQDTIGDFSSPSYCEFQIFQNLETTLYFKDVAGPQDTTISTFGRPASPTKQTTATFSFSAASDPSASFECRLDRPAQTGFYGACEFPSSQSYSNLTTNGQYTFYVRAKDPSGNVDETPASYTWTIDTVAPTVTLDSGPTGPTNDSTPTFGFHASETSTMACSIDDGPTSACNAGSYTPAALSDGAHTFKVVPTDSAGNQGAAAQQAFTVDTQAPETTIDGGPGGPTNDPTPTFSFHASQANSTFACTLDGASQACNSGSFTPGMELGEGQHTFSVIATDPAGNADASADSRTFTVDMTPPTVTLRDHPPVLIKLQRHQRRAKVKFSFDSNDPNATFECYLDNKEPVPCTSPKTYRAGKGLHSFAVGAIDQAGNQSPLASFTFKVKKPR